MKIAFATTLLSLFFPASWALKKLNKKALSALQKKNFKKVTHSHKKLRKLNEEGDEEEAEEDEYEFLKNYEQVYVSCDPDKKVKDENGDYETGAVVYRLCPSGSGCSDGKICSAGHGDYVVGLQTYMRSFLEQFEQEQEENNGDDEDDENAFDFGDFGECKKYDIEVEDDGNDEDGDEQEDEYFIGPLCTEDGDIRIAFFKGDGQNDEEDQCIPDNESDDFYTLTGFYLPWSTSILEDDECKSYYCSVLNEDGEYEYNEFCVQLFEETSAKCETEMEYYSPYGIDETGCEEISAMLPASSGGSAGAWVVFVVLVLVIGGFGMWYFMNQKKKSAASQEGLMM